MPKFRPFAIFSNTITEAFTLLIALPATIVATFLAVALVSSPGPMAKQLALSVIGFQATGRDSAPEQLHYEICDKASPVQIFCESRAVVAFTVEEVSDAVKRIYFALVLASLLVWILFLLPSKVRTWKGGVEALTHSRPQS